jgi:DNA-binding transcriptional ArsR family regulator
METELIRITSLIGDPVRTTILWTLLDGKAYTTTELSICSNTSLQNICVHLHKLVEADLLQVESQGRHRYYRLANQDVAYAIEAIGNLVPERATKKTLTGPVDDDVRYCRICYDHLAGETGVRLTDHLFSQKIIELRKKSYLVTSKGNKFFAELGIEIDKLKAQRRLFAQACLDWSERKYHLAGSLGASLLDTMIGNDWIRRKKDSRAFIITGKGKQELYRKMKFEV